MRERALVRLLVPTGAVGGHSRWCSHRPERSEAARGMLPAPGAEDAETDVIAEDAEPAEIRFPEVPSVLRALGV